MGKGGGGNAYRAGLLGESIAIETSILVKYESEHKLLPHAVETRLNHVLAQQNKFAFN